jgi:aminopeptidase N
MDDPIRGTEKVSFDLADASEPVVFDFAQPAANVVSVAANGQPADHQLSNEHLVLAAPSGENFIEIDFIAGDGSLNRNDDFLYTLFVPDRARVAFPVFDQPNLKGRFKLSLEAPSSWQAVSNGSLEPSAPTSFRSLPAASRWRPRSGTGGK